MKSSLIMEKLKFRFFSIDYQLIAALHVFPWNHGGFRPAADREFARLAIIAGSAYGMQSEIRTVTTRVPSVSRPSEV